MVASEKQKKVVGRDQIRKKGIVGRDQIQKIRSQMPSQAIEHVGQKRKAAQNQEY
jgi:hypothetical protein